MSARFKLRMLHLAPFVRMVLRLGGGSELVSVLGVGSISLWFYVWASGLRLPVVVKSYFYFVRSIGCHIV